MAEGAYCKKKRHNWNFHETTKLTDPDKPIAPVLRICLLYRDTSDAYKMGDGDHIIPNAKFEWVFDSALSHSMYTIWLWRKITYVNYIIPPDRHSNTNII